MDPRLGGVTEGIPWTRMEINGRRVRVPHATRQFVVLYGLDIQLDGKPANAVARADTLEVVPPDERRNWPGIHLQLAPALREAIERQEAWMTHAIGMLGAANAAASAGAPTTLFEEKAYQNRQRSGWSGRRAATPDSSVLEGGESASARRRRASQRRVKYPTPGMPALPSPEHPSTDSIPPPDEASPDPA
jgi:hypothetical protein